MSQLNTGALASPQTHDDDFWTADLDRFDVDLYIAELEDKQLWHQTCLGRITAHESELNLLGNSIPTAVFTTDIILTNGISAIQGTFLNDNDIMKLGPSSKKEDEGQLPAEEYGLLRISPDALRHLASTYHVPSAFLAAISRERPEFGSSFRRQSKHEWNYWCVLPCRASEQMDPFSDIYFESQGARIQGHTVALYINRDSGTRKLRVFVVDRVKQERGLRAQEPLVQIQKGLERRSSMDLDGSPCFALLVYISCILRWWDVVLMDFDNELISHERTIQKDIANATEEFVNTSKVLNATLHAMAAHLYRYKTELKRVEMVLSDLRKYRKEMTYTPKPKRRDGEERKQEEEKEEGEDEFPPIDRELEKIGQLASQLTVISSMADEMEKKVQNILALLFNQIQAINDKTLQAILSASQQETRISQRLSLASHMLSRSMKRDSIAMKTVPHSRYGNLSLLVMSSWELIKETLGHIRDAILH
ncbi:uncharacterized protein NECHADRAFT_87705 [Fusarium vanettenii 77-13-4]|uniref:Uncharacterized protein n=1 Tax=Fusarium vanettenii (strain ATCC MYA-4622 / CBS 123669 / FGSC 9596 / NRRL 45880 / 77-13-4) TaxID=660122 RepID=C7Z2S9_FUSV7|nr:uncharacterized protein NECHADRAFT_87705 [Fusarium vanettenii 77-13-4]EEU41715.1 predicted protein [Fusarium vanettenii 77-13-4]